MEVKENLDFFDMIQGGVVKEKPKKIKKKTELELAIIPSNSNLSQVKHEKVSKKEKKVDVTKVPKTKVFKYTGAGNPFKTSRSFLFHYRGVIQGKSNKKIFFPTIDSDMKYAAEILDILKDKKKENLEFLNKWITFYYQYSLRGNKIHNRNKTSLKSFKSTFDDFHRRA